MGCNFDHSLFLKMCFSVSLWKYSFRHLSISLGHVFLLFLNEMCRDIQCVATVLLNALLSLTVLLCRS